MSGSHADGPAHPVGGTVAIKDEDGMNGLVGKGIMVAAVAALAGVGAAGTAIAGGNCAAYAKLTLQQAKQNKDRRCNFKGSAWSLDARGHHAWCKQVGPAVWRAELKKRKAMLDGCKG